MEGNAGAHNTRMAIRIERWRIENHREYIKPGMGEIAILGMKYLYPPFGIRPDGTQYVVTEFWNDGKAK